VCAWPHAQLIHHRSFPAPRPRSLLCGVGGFSGLGVPGFGPRRWAVAEAETSIHQGSIDAGRVVEGPLPGCWIDLD
jgi:hypothetical protein